MQMDKEQIPEIFIHSTFLSCMTGIGCALITVIVFFVTGDRTLLFLGGVASMLFIGKGILLYRTVKQKRYETVEGSCYYADTHGRKPYPKIRLEMDSGQELSLFLDKKQIINHGHRYRFYFAQGTVPDLKESTWFPFMRTDGIIGFEEIPDDGISTR